MRFNLTLQPQTGKYLPINYHYPFSAAIYKIIQKADEGYASFLHEEGYKHNGKSFKLFTFSDIRTPFSIKGDRLLMKTSTAELTVCFHIPDAASHFIKGLFMHQQLQVADKISRVVFTVQQVEMINDAVSNADEVLLQPMSPVVIGRKNDRGNYDYLSPLDAGYTDLLISNLLEKYKAVHQPTEEEIKHLKENIKVDLVFTNAPRQRLLTIKAGTAAETKIKGFDKLRLKISAPKEILELGLNAGVGLHNAQGMGCMGVV